MRARKLNKTKSKLGISAEVKTDVELCRKNSTSGWVCILVPFVWLGFPEFLTRYLSLKHYSKYSTQSVANTNGYVFVLGLIVGVFFKEVCVRGCAPLT